MDDWFQTLPDDVLSAHALHFASPLSRERLLARYTAAMESGDCVTLAAMLPQVLQMDRQDSERAQMLNCCGAANMNVTRGRPSLLLEATFEEVVATAPAYSRLHASGLINVASFLQCRGHHRETYRIARALLRHRAAFIWDSATRARADLLLSSAASMIGKRRMARQALERFALEPAFQFTGRPLIEILLFSRTIQTMTLSEAKLAFQRIHPGNPYALHLWGSYAGILLRHDFPRAALRMATQALHNITQTGPFDTSTRIELLIIMAAASHRIGRADVAATLMSNAQDLMGTEKLIRPPFIGKQDWLAVSPGR